jgi:two-component system, LytTR family, response regulator
LEEPIEPLKTAETPDFIFVKVEHKIKKINLIDILYIEGLKDYVSIYTKTERILSLQTMKKIEESLPTPRFYRVHKSYIIAVDKIDYIERQRIFIGKNSIPLSDTYRDGFMKVLDM